MIQEIDGEYRTLELPITTLMERPEGYTGRLVVIHDNTPRKRAEESLLRREMILEAISFEAELLLSGVSWEDSLPQVLRQLGVATGANHVYIDQNDSAEATSWKITRRIEWHDEHEQRRMNEKTSVPIDGSNFTRWLEVLSRGRAVYA